MRAAVIHAATDSPRFEEFADPQCGEGEVLVEVLAAGLHPVVKALAAGTHYGSSQTWPLIPGIDGVGRMADGSRVFFGLGKKPYGTMAERACPSRSMCFPVPERLDSATAAAILNPGVSAWLALTGVANLAAGETVLVLGATGVAGQLAVQLAKRFGAGRVIAAGRNSEALASLPDLGADAVISLAQSSDNVVQDFAAEAKSGIDIVIDYLWGLPTELLIQAVTRKGLTHFAKRIRLIDVGNSAGEKIALPAEALRSSSLQIFGTGAGSVPMERILRAVPEFLEMAAQGELRIRVETASLSAIDEIWKRSAQGKRFVILP